MKHEKLAGMISSYLPEKDSGSRSILPLYTDHSIMKEIVSYLAEPFRGKVDFVASPEPQGFILGSMISVELGVGLIALRKYRMDPPDNRDLLVASYIDHRDQVKTLVVKQEMIPKGSRILLVDDWIQTAATIQAGMTLIEEAGAALTGIASIGTEHNAGVQSLMDSVQVHCIYQR